MASNTKNLEFKHIDGEPNMEEMPFYQDPNFIWRNLGDKRVYVHYTILDGSTAGNYTTFWIAPVKCSLVAVKESHNAAGSDNGALNIEKLSDGTAEGSGTEMLSSDIDLTATADTVQDGTIKRKEREILKGQRVALKDANTLTGVGSVTVVLEIKLTR